jgi:ABC-2 type transport system ATP-binding protein
MITINNLSKSYTGTPALKGISLEVKRGELYGLIGPDGAGKTTLMRILMTLLLPDSGSAGMDGLDVLKDYKKIRRITGYMPGRFSLYHDLSIEENIRFFASVFGTTPEENYDLIKDIYKQIEPFKKRRAGDLSGGMKQKLALSCALIHRPKILILDEPTTGVDAVSRKEFWEMLRNLQAKEITILVSTPYMDEANLCDRVALVQSGQVLEVDSPANITKRFPHKIIKVRSDEMYRLITDLRNYEKTDSAYAFGQYVHFTGSDDNLNPSDLKAFLNERNHRNLEASFIEPGIEDVFMKLMNTVEMNQSATGKREGFTAGN